MVGKRSSFADDEQQGFRHLSACNGSGAWAYTAKCNGYRLEPMRFVQIGAGSVVPHSRRCLYPFFLIGGRCQRRASMFGQVTWYRIGAGVSFPDFTEMSRCIAARLEIWAVVLCPAPKFEPGPGFVGWRRWLVSGCEPVPCLLHITIHLTHHTAEPYGRAGRRAVPLAARPCFFSNRRGCRDPGCRGRCGCSLR